MTSCMDYEDENGDIDWDAYRAAQIASGKRCIRCGTYIILGSGGPTVCTDCKGLDEDDGEVDHDSMIRCPKCGEQFDVQDSGFYELYQDGEHDVMCQECEHEFEISTRVSHTFKSPERIKDNVDE